MKCPSLCDNLISSVLFFVIIYPIIATHQQAGLPSLKLARSRLLREWKSVQSQRIDLCSSFNETEGDDGGIRLGPLPNNLLEWHFSFIGPKNSVYSKGIYHGRILLSDRYPGKAPRIQMITPSGRFVCFEDICLSASAYHQESWDPSWNLQTIVTALRSYMTTTAQEIGGIETTRENRHQYAMASRDYVCMHCHTSHKHLLHPQNDTTSLIPKPILSVASSKQAFPKAKALLYSILFIILSKIIFTSILL